MEWHIFLSLSICVANTVGQTSLDRCPTNLNRDQYLQAHGNYCYQFTLDHHGYWSQAKQHCSRDGGRLVKIENMDQELFIVSALTHLGFHGKAIWIGLTDIVQEGVYVWTDGQGAQFTYWAPGEPSFTHNFEDCVALKVTGHGSGHWYDYPCDLVFDAFSWICQYDMLPGATMDLQVIVQETTAQPAITTNAPVITQAPVTTLAPLNPVTQNIVGK